MENNSNFLSTLQTFKVHHKSLMHSKNMNQLFFYDITFPEWKWLNELCYSIALHDASLRAKFRSAGLEAEFQMKGGGGNLVFTLVLFIFFFLCLYLCISISSHV